MAVVTCCGLHAQTQWSLEKDKDGIQVYSADSGGSKFKAVKVICSPKGNLQKFLTILLDVDGHKNWVYSTKKSYQLKKTSSDSILYYAELSFPWPLSNRDVVILMTTRIDAPGHNAVIFTDGEPDSLPKKDGLVRVPFFHARYEVTEVADGRLQIVYYTLANPGGGLGPGFTNLFLAKAPYNTFKNLCALLSR
ncbi:MAG TPA: START domain-containing protein [Chitinophagaceae bacterium]|nr:START domain-containing protein [Chitinophagaceae bacterium]